MKDRSAWMQRGFPVEFVLFLFRHRVNLAGAEPFVHDVADRIRSVVLMYARSASV